MQSQVASEHAVTQWRTYDLNRRLVHYEAEVHGEAAVGVRALVAAALVRLVALHRTVIARALSPHLCSTTHTRTSQSSGGRCSERGLCV
jgi:hypothetical protein